MVNNSYKLPVKQGYRCYALADMAYKNFKNGKLTAMIEDVNGNVINSVIWTGGNEYVSGAMAFTQVGGLFDITDEAAAFVQLKFSAIGKGSANGELFVDNIAFGVASSLQEVLPNYTIGRSDPYADYTATSPVFIAAQEIIDESVNIIYSANVQVSFVDGIITTTLPVVIGFNAFVGAASVDNEGVYTVLSTDSGISANVTTGTNILNITSVSNSGNITVRFTRNSKTYDRVVNIGTDNINTSTGDFDFPNIEGYYQSLSQYLVSKIFTGASGLNAVDFTFTPNASYFGSGVGRWSANPPKKLLINNTPIDMVETAFNAVPTPHDEYTLQTAGLTLNLVSGSLVNVELPFVVDDIAFDGGLNAGLTTNPSPVGLLLGTITITNTTTSTALDTINVYG